MSQHDHATEPLGKEVSAIWDSRNATVMAHWERRSLVNYPHIFD